MNSACLLFQVWRNKHNGNLKIDIDLTKQQQPSTISLCWSMGSFMGGCDFWGPCLVSVSFHGSAKGPTVVQWHDRSEQTSLVGPQIQMDTHIRTSWSTGNTSMTIWSHEVISILLPSFYYLCVCRQGTSLLPCNLPNFTLLSNSKCLRLPSADWELRLSSCKCWSDCTDVGFPLIWKYFFS